jgi:hypothetical protein
MVSWANSSARLKVRVYSGIKAAWRLLESAVIRLWAGL